MPWNLHDVQNDPTAHGPPKLFANAVTASSAALDDVVNAPSRSPLQLRKSETLEPRRAHARPVDAEIPESTFVREEHSLSLAVGSSRYTD